MDIAWTEENNSRVTFEEMKRNQSVVREQMQKNWPDWKKEAYNEIFDYSMHFKPLKSNNMITYSCNR